MDAGVSILSSQKIYFSNQDINFVNGLTLSVFSWYQPHDSVRPESSPSDVYSPQGAAGLLNIVFIPYMANQSDKVSGQCHGTHSSCRISELKAVTNLRAIWPGRCHEYNSSLEAVPGLRTERQLAEWQSVVLQCTCCLSFCSQHWSQIVSPMVWMDQMDAWVLL